MIVAGSILSLAACAVLMGLLLAGFWSPWAIFGPAVVAAFANGLSMPNAEAAVVGVVPALGGSASGMTSALVLAVSAVFAQGVGAALGQNGAGQIGAGPSPYPLGLAMLLAATLALLAFLGAQAAARRRGQAG